MRILNLKFANINSLYGKWEIDFEDKAFQSAGIFAITGPTGSGKTTILDAICLALYDHTPRVSNPTKGDFKNNEVMNWDASECSAELEFETKNGRYKACWEQKKNKSRNPDAPESIALPNVRLYRYRPDGGSLDLLAKNKTEKQKQIIAAIGMGFDQFTRSVLLSQGDFAAFLKADKKVRAETLEKITGTEIYSEISSKIFEKTKAKKQAYTEQQTRLGDLKTLSPEERRALEKTKEDLATTLDKNTKQLKEFKAQQDWLDEIQTLDSDLTDKKEKLAALTDKKPDYDEKKVKIENAARAEKIAPQFNKLEENRSGFINLQNELEANQKELKTCSQKRSAKKEEVSAANQNAETAQSSYNSLKELIVAVVGLDKNIEETKKELQVKEKILSEVTQNKDNKEKELNAAKQDRQRRATSIEKLQEEVSALKKWELSESKRAELGKLLEDHIDKTRRLSAQQKQCDQFQQELGKLQKSFGRAQTELGKLEEEIQSINGNIDTKKENLNSKLDGKELSSFYASGPEAKQAFEKGEDCLKKAKKFSSEKEELEKKKTELDDLEKDLNSKAELIKSKEEVLDNINQHLESVNALIKIHDLVGERANLKEGEPCPLCGSTTHPFAKELPAGLEKSQSKKKKLDKEVKELQDEINSLRVSIARDTGSIDGEKKSWKKANEKFDRELRVFCEENRSLVDVTTEISVEWLIEQLKPKIQKLKDNSEKTERLVNEVKTLETELNELNKRLKAAQDKEKSEKDKNSKLKGDLDRLEGRFESAKAVLKQAEKDVTALEFTATRDFSEFLKEETDKEGLWKALKSTLSNAQHFVEKNKALEKKKNDEKVLAQRIEGLSSAFDQIQHGWEEKTSDLKKEESSLNILLAERKEKFGDKDPKVEEEKAKKRLDSTQFVREQALKELERIEKRYIQLETSINDETKRFNELQLSLQANEQKWIQSLAEAAFVDETAWQQAKLDAENVKELQNEVAAYEKDCHALDLSIRETQKKLKDKKEKSLTDKSLEVVTSLIGKLEEQNAEVLTEQGKVEQQLKTDDEALQNRARLGDELKKLEKEKAIWDRLNDLVGSAEGDKYKVFVQSLLLKSLIQKANKELSRITDRYTLVAGNENLDIHLIDNDLAGQERTSYNLSGGETFMVSLALALGLSRMASRNVQINSLFLDEGFGTLDQESLERALSALGHLNAQGKLVGVISHVQLIRDRIPVQISVERMGEGRSRLKGPGVTRLAGA